MYPSGIVQVVLSLGIVAVTVIAALAQKWEIVSMAMAGGFALFSPSGGKERKDEKIIDLVDPV